MQSRLQSFDQKIRELRELRDRAQSEQENLKERLKGATAVQQIREELEKKKIGSKLATLSAQDASAEIAGALEVARYNAQTASQTIAAMESEKNTFIQGWYGEVSQRLLEVKNQTNVLSEEVSKAKLRKNLVDIRAQVDGVVQSLAKLSVGSVLAPGAGTVGVYGIFTTSLNADTSSRLAIVDFTSAGMPSNVPCQARADNNLNATWDFSADF
jgi:HlyD family secretion protein